MHKYLLVNLNTVFLNGIEEKTIQPKWLNKYFNHILVSPYNLVKTMDKLLTMGFKRGVGGVKKGIDVDCVYGLTLFPYEELIGKDKKLPTLQFKKIAEDYFNLKVLNLKLKQSQLKLRKIEEKANV